MNLNESASDSSDGLIAVPYRDPHPSNTDSIGTAYTPTAKPQVSGEAQAEPAPISAPVATPLAEPPATPPTTPPATPPSSVTLDDVQKQVAKLGREHFKLNTLLETQQRQTQTALQQLSDHQARRDRERSELLAQRAGELSRERLKLLERVLPALDGLDEAIATLDRAAQAKRPNWWQRLRGTTGPAPEATVAWRNGLVIVRDRLLNVLAEEGVRPIDSAGAKFDPALHVALQHVPATSESPAGTIVREVRRGYIVGGLPLRYADVVVARS